MSSEAHLISLIAPRGFIGRSCDCSPYFKRIGLGSVLGYFNCRLDHWTIWLCIFPRFYINFAYRRIRDCHVPVCDWAGNAAFTFMGTQT